MKKFCISFIGYVIVFAVLRRIFPGGILFYQGVILGIVFAICHWIASVRFTWFLSPTPIKDAVLLFLLTYSFMFTIPTTVERSYSVKMYQLISSSENGVEPQVIERWFAKEFSMEGGIQKRLAEQKVTGSIRELQGRYYLTAFGRFINVCFAITRFVFSC